MNLLSTNSLCQHLTKHLPISPLEKLLGDSFPTICINQDIRFINSKILYFGGPGNLVEIYVGLSIFKVHFRFITQIELCRFCDSATPRDVLLSQVVSFEFTKLIVKMGGLSSRITLICSKFVNSITIPES